MLDPIVITLLSHRVHRQNTKQQNKKASVSAWNHGNSHIAVIFYKKKNMHTKFIKLVSRGNRYYRDKGKETKKKQPPKHNYCTKEVNKNGYDHINRNRSRSRSVLGPSSGREVSGKMKSKRRFPASVRGGIVCTGKTERSCRYIE